MCRIGGKRLGANWKSKAGEDGTVGDRIGTAWSVEAGMERSVVEWWKVARIERQAGTGMSGWCRTR